VAKPDLSSSIPEADASDCNRCAKCSKVVRCASGLSPESAGRAITVGVASIFMGLDSARE